MSEALLFGDGGRKAGRSETLLSRLLWVVVAVLALVLVGELAFHLWLAPRLVVRNIVIQSDLPLTQAEILAVAGIEGTPSYFSLREDSVRKRLAALPAVRRAEVHKSFPDTLRITLAGRKPLSLLFFGSGSGQQEASVPLAVDDQGVVFQMAASIADWDLPVISGVRFASAEMGMRLPESVQPLLEDLAALRAGEPALFRLISEVRLVSRSDSIGEILVYPVPYGVRLRLGPRLQAGPLRTAVVILDLLEKQGLRGRLRELDLRTGDVVYTLKED